MELSVPASTLLHGVLSFDDLGHSWVRPHRFVDEQRAALVSCAAWYPGIYHQMSLCTSGMTLEFVTDSTFLTLDVVYDSLPQATLNVLRGSEAFLGVAHTEFDGFAYEVDGNANTIKRIPLKDEKTAAALEIDVFSAASQSSNQPLDIPLPGMGEEHTVRVWLPALRGCELGFVKGNGSYINAVAERDQLLILGDSIAQGYSVPSPNYAWSELACCELNYALYNQSVGGQVFQTSALAGLETVRNTLNPKTVIVALGTNYRYGKCSSNLVGREIKAYLERVDELFPAASVLVLIPDVASYDAVPFSCYKEIPQLIETAASSIKAKRIGQRRPALLASPMPALEPSQLADAGVHPNVAGHKATAEFVVSELSKFECACLAEFGQYGRCGACVHGETQETEPEA